MPRKNGDLTRAEVRAMGVPEEVIDAPPPRQIRRYIAEVEVTMFFREDVVAFLAKREEKEAPPSVAPS